MLRGKCGGNVGKEVQEGFKVNFQTRASAVGPWWHMNIVPCCMVPLALHLPPVRMYIVGEQRPLRC